MRQYYKVNKLQIYYFETLQTPQCTAYGVFALCMWLM